MFVHISATVLATFNERYMADVKMGDAVTKKAMKGLKKCVA